MHNKYIAILVVATSHSTPFASRILFKSIFMADINKRDTQFSANGMNIGNMKKIFGILTMYLCQEWPRFFLNTFLWMERKIVILVQIKNEYIFKGKTDTFSKEKRILFAFKIRQSEYDRQHLKLMKKMQKFRWKWRCHSLRLHWKCDKLCTD